MICPHCSANLLRKQRSGRVCGTCKRGFVFDPKSNALGVHDIRIRRLVDRLGEQQFWYTSQQLWYAAARKSVTTKAKATGCLPSLPILGIMALVGGIAVGFTTVVVIGAVVIGVSLLVLLLRLAGVPRPRIRIGTDLGVFRGNILDEWPRLHGAPLPGLVDEERFVAGEQPRDPAFAVLSPDRAVLMCLQSNNVAERFAAALAEREADLPPDVPVVLLHDATANGLIFAVQASNSLAERRVVDLGLRPSMVMSGGALRLRDRRPLTERISWLRTTGRYRPDELDWLEQGWWSPVAALRPGQLLARVESAAQRFRQAGDPAERSAAAVGFLTWPTT